MVYKCIRKCYYRDRYFKEGDTLTCKETDGPVPRHFIKVRLQSEVVGDPPEEKPKERFKGVALKDLADEAKEQDEAEHARLGLGPKKSQSRDKKGK